MKKKFLALFFSSLLFSVFSQSLFDDSKNLYDDNFNISADENSLFSEDKSFFNEDKNLVQNDKSFFNTEKNIIPDDGIGIYEKFVEKGIENSVENGYEENTISVVEDKYIGNYGKFLDVTSDNLEARKRFVNYFTDWQRLGMPDDFFEYAGDRAEQEKQIEYCYNRALLKFGVGTGIVATTWIVAFVVPGGTVYQVAVLIIAKSTTVGALSGGAIGGITSAGIGLLQGKRGDELVCYTVNGAADGYLVGAITGLVQGTGKVYKLFKEAKNLKAFSGAKTIFDNKVYDANNYLIIDLKKYGADAQCLFNCGKKNIDEGIVLIKDFGNDAAYVLKNAKPNEFEAIKNIFYNIGSDGINNLKKNHSVAIWFYKKYSNPKDAAEIIKNVGFPPKYSNNRPSYAPNQVEEVWNMASANGKKAVRDPHTGKKLEWDKTKSREGQWDMGHRTGQEYNKLRDMYYRGEISEEEFLSEYRNPNNYYPEDPSVNRGHIYEEVH